MEGVNADTVWTWNAIGKRSGTWGLAADAPEATRGFLLNHLIAELLPEQPGGYRFSNSDPVTGQAAWYDLRVRIEKAGPHEAKETSPRFEPLRPPPAYGVRPLASTSAARSQPRGKGSDPVWSAAMTALPAATSKKLGLVIDLDTCVGCQACATSCKEWNTQGYSAPLTDQQPYGADPHGAWLNRVHGYEVGEGAASRTVHFPRSCLHCEEPDCVTVCPTGASFKRAEDGIVLVDPGDLHRLQAVLVGLPLRRPRVRLRPRRHEEMHAVRRPHLQPAPPRGGSHPRLRARLPDGRPPLRRPRRSRQRRLATRRRARRLRSAACVRLQARQQVPAPASPARRDHRSCRGPTPRTRAEAASGATGAAADRLFAWVDRVLSR